MALTGDLAQLHITDIIQLIHTTRQSGTFSVRSSRGESRIIFSNGYMVGANHLNSRIRIGSVLVGMKAISVEDLKFALEAQRKAGKDRRPLISTLKQTGKLKDDAAFRALKKLIEITVIELISWKEGSFTFDADAISVSPECAYNPGEMEQEQSLDAQMVLMDALRIYDERERDRMSGVEVRSDEGIYCEALPASALSSVSQNPVITADILGLTDLDQLENRVPVKPVTEGFDPEAIHRTKMIELMPDFSPTEQEEMTSFLKEAAEKISFFDEPAVQKRHACAMVLFSGDQLLAHSLLTVCKGEGISIFGVSRRADIDKVAQQCFRMGILPVLVLDCPDENVPGLTERDLSAVRLDFKRLHPRIPCIQLVHACAYEYSMRCLGDCVRTVFPKPDRLSGKQTYVKDMIMFLKTFLSLSICLSADVSKPSPEEMLKHLKDKAASLRMLEGLEEVSAFILDAVSSSFGRAMLFFVEDAGLVMTRAAFSKDMPSVQTLIPSGRYSVFDDVIGAGQSYFGESSDETLNEHLYNIVGRPRDRMIFILPLKVSGQVKSLVYADFGEGDRSPVITETFEILALEAGVVLENAVYRQQILKRRK